MRNKRTAQQNGRDTWKTGILRKLPELYCYHMRYLMPRGSSDTWCCITFKFCCHHINRRNYFASLPQDRSLDSVFPEAQCLWGLVYAWYQERTIPSLVVFGDGSASPVHAFLPGWHIGIFLEYSLMLIFCLTTSSLQCCGLGFFKFIFRGIYSSWDVSVA